MDEKDHKDVEKDLDKNVNSEMAEEKAEVAQEKAELAEEKARLETKEAMEEEMQEEIRNFAETSPEMGPNSFWGAGGTWWVLGIAGLLIIFLVIWVCFFYGPN